MRIYKKFSESHRVTLHLGNCMDLLKALPDECVDLVVTSPPYCIGKAYEDPHNDIKTFKDQVGYHISDKCVVPLDYIVYEIFTSRSENLDYPFILRNRIIWTFGHAYEEIKEQETQAMIDCGDEYAIECTGQVEMDPDELNDLVADRDPHALEFFILIQHQKHFIFGQKVEQITNRIVGDFQNGKSFHHVFLGRAAIKFQTEMHGLFYTSIFSSIHWE